MTAPTVYHLRNNDGVETFTGTISPAPGGGSQPVAWSGPLEADFSDYDADFFGTGSGGIPIAGFAIPDGGQVFRYLIHITSKFVYDDSGPTVPFVGLTFYDVGDPTNVITPGGFEAASTDPSDWEAFWVSSVGSASPPNAGTVDVDTYADVYAQGSPYKPGAFLKLAGTVLIGLSVSPAGGGSLPASPSQGHAKVWVEMFTPPS